MARNPSSRPSRGPRPRRVNVHVPRRRPPGGRRGGGFVPVPAHAHVPVHVYVRMMSRVELESNEVRDGRRR